MKRHYDGILIAPDFYFKRFDDNLRGMLHDHRNALYVPATYHKMVRFIDLQFANQTSVTEYDPGKIFRENKEILDVYRLDAVEGRLKGKGDIMSVARAMSAEHGRTKARYLLVSSDIMLIQLVVFNKLEIDLYDVFGEKLIEQRDFPKFHDERRYSWELDESSWIKDRKLPTADTSQEELTLYDEEGKPYRLKKSDHPAGGEAVLYACDDEPGYLAKVFSEDNTLTVSKCQSIRGLNKMAQTFPFPWLMLPKKLLYLNATQTDPETGAPAHPVAFLMEEATEFTDLDNEPAFNVFKEGQKVSRGLEISRNLLWQIMVLAMFGIYPYDFNPSNFGFAKITPNIVMVDTDSFVAYGYLPSVAAGDLWGYPTLKAGKTSVEDVIRSCVRTAYIFLAYLLMRRQNVLLDDGEINQKKVKKDVYRIPEPVREPLLDALVCPWEEMPYYDALLIPLIETAADSYYQQCTYEDLERRDYSEAPKKENGWEGSKAYAGPKEPKPRSRREPVEDTLYISKDIFSPTPAMKRGGKPIRVIHPRKPEKKAVQLVPVPPRKMYTLPEPEEDVRKKQEKQLRKRRIWAVVLVTAVMLIFWAMLFADLGMLEQLQQLLTAVRERLWAWVREHLQDGPRAGTFQSFLE